MSCKEEPSPIPTPTPTSPNPAPTPNPLVYHGNVILPDQNAVTKFAANHYEIIEGSLRLGVVYDEHQESGPSSSNIIDLSSLLGLRRITGALDITQTFSLKTLNGLDSLTYIGSLQIFGDDVITTYSPLNKLDSINGFLFLQSIQ